MDQPSSHCRFLRVPPTSYLSKGDGNASHGSACMHLYTTQH